MKNFPGIHQKSRKVLYSKIFDKNFSVAISAHGKNLPSKIYKNT